MKAMESKTEEIYKNGKGYFILACYLSDQVTMRQEVGLFIETPDESISEVIRLKKSRIISSNTSLDFLLDMQGDFDKKDIDAIHAHLLESLDKLPVVCDDRKVPFNEVYRELCNYAREYQQEDLITIQDGYCNIDSKKFRSIVAEMDFGYNKLEIIRTMKIRGLLRINKNRSYDWAMTDKDGNTYRAISFKDSRQKEKSKC
jgi:hypothetical protein